MRASENRGGSCQRPQDVVPTLSILAPDERVGLRGVARAQLLVIPFDLLSRSIGDIAEMVRFRRPAGVLKIRAWHGPDTLRVVHPLDPVTGRPRQGLGRHLEILE